VNVPTLLTLEQALEMIGYVGKHAPIILPSKNEECDEENSEDSEDFEEDDETEE
jgi:hypothetical protein